MISKIFLFVFAACVAVNAELTKNDFGNLPLRFEPIPDKSGPARFLARGNGYTLFLSDNGAFLQSPAASVRMKMVGANPSASIMAQQPLPGATNYLIGNDPSKWRTGVTGFARVEYRGIYSGIDLVYYGKEGHLEYDFVIAAGADPRKIRIAFDGAARLALDKNGDLVVSASGQTLSFRRPVLYQIIRGEKRPIAGHYDLHGRQVEFKVSEYDASLPLVIDPVLLYSTFFGGPGDLIFAIATDASGSVYMTGATVGTIPIVNAEQPTPKGATAFITKINAAGTALIYSTFIGGSGGDYGSGIGVDSSGNAYIAGYTSSRDFPTVNPIQPELRAKTNAFAAKLNAAGSALIYSTYLGGSYFNQANAIAVDSAGNVYVAGSTFSSDFPTVAPFQPTLSGQKAAFVAKVNAAGSALAYSTYLGGSTTTGVNQPQTAATGIAVDSAGSAYVTGNTCTNNFPIVNPFQATNHSYCNVFITKFAPDGAALVYSTYLGGSAGAPFFQAPDDFQCCPVLGGDSSGRIAVDSEGNAYVAGLALSSDFPVVNALQPKLSGVGSAFTAKLNASGSGLIYSTYLGGGSYASGIAVDSAGNAYISGNTGVLVDEFPLVMPIQSVAGGAVVAELNPTGSALVFSTYFGGVGIPPMPFAIAVDSAGNIYLAGEAYSSIPLVNPIQPAPAAPNSLASSSFLAKIGPADAAGLALTPAALDFSNIFLGTSPTQYITLFAAGSQLLDIAGITASGDFTQTNNCPPTLLASACTIAITFAPIVEGLQTGTLLIASNAGTRSVNLTGFALRPGLTAPIQNAATFSYANVAGSLASVFGVDLEASTTAVTVIGSSGSYTATILYLSPTQINFQIPWEVAGSSQVLVKVDTISIRLPLSAIAPGIFALNAQGTGPGAIVNSTTGVLAQPVGSVPTDGTLPVTSGQSISIFATGLGALAGHPPPDGSPPSGLLPIAAPATVTIGGITVTPSFAGLAPFFVGLYQVDAQVPTGVSSGNAVPVFMTVGGVISNTVTIAVQ